MVLRCSESSFESRPSQSRAFVLGGTKPFVALMADFVKGPRQVCPSRKAGIEFQETTRALSHLPLPIHIAQNDVFRPGQSLLRYSPAVPNNIYHADIPQCQSSSSTPSPCFQKIDFLPAVCDTLDAYVRVVRGNEY